ncbi:MAG: dihydrolipoyllysine-residue acetyltransferase [Methylococcaceae bacterium]|nr:dihydrolipoyllysine-residue acetyltransferase [Methylococcaceae bacterium]
MEQTVLVPNIGDIKDVEVIEILVKSGDPIKLEQSLITLESDKATMEVPAPFAGTVDKILVKLGDRVGEGSEILSMTVSEAAGPSSTPTPEPEKPAIDAVDAEKAPASPPDETKRAPEPSDSPPPVPESSSQHRQTAHAGPSVRRFARELGVDLCQVQGSGRKGRILHEDVKQFVKTSLQKPIGGISDLGNLSASANVDFSRFGEIESRNLSRIKKSAGAHLHRSWLGIPHVTQHGGADITGLEEFRKNLKPELEPQGIRLTLLPFLMKAVVAVLKRFPDFNASLGPGAEVLILKQYYHIGVAVDTPEGLVVPVVRHVDKKGLAELATELGELSARAREKKLKPDEMQGGSFTISSLGGIGGSAFTPIINQPEVAILGVSRAEIRPVFRDPDFVPRLILPLSLSYNHRVIDGAAAARFIVFLAEVLGDLRRLLI